MFSYKFYRTGMISLIFIPILCIPALQKEFIKNDLRILKFNLPEPTYEKNRVLYNFYQLDIIRKEADFEVFEVEKLTKSRLDSLVQGFSKLHTDKIFLSKMPNRDYRFGIKTKLTSDASYENLVNLINSCSKYKQYTYALDLRYDEFYIYDEIMQYEKEYTNNGFANCVVYTSDVDKRSALKKELGYFKTNMLELKTYFKNGNIILFLYCCLLCFTIFYSNNYYS